MRSFVLALILAAAPAVLGASPAVAAPVVELVELPSQLELPLAAGTNRLFAVKIPGAPEAVWMAVSPDAKLRLPLQPMGQRWVFNLGDPRVAEVVAGGGQFQVFATVGGETGASLPVQFIAARAASAYVELIGADGTRLDRTGWVDPAKVQRLAVRWDGAGARSTVRLVAGGRRIEVEPSASEVEIAVDGALRAAWQAAGALEVIDGRGHARSIARAIPSTLGPAARTPFRIVQRRGLDVPGSGGFLRVHLGDISGTRVPVTVTGADGTIYVDQRLLTEGDRAEFALGSVRHVLIVDRLVNMLFGDDHAEFHVEPAAEALADPAR